MAMHASDPHICMHMMNETGRPVIGPCPTLCCPWRCAASQNETRRVSSLRCQTLQRMSLYLSQSEMTLDNIGERLSIDSLRLHMGFSAFSMFWANPQSAHGGRSRLFQPAARDRQWQPHGHMTHLLESDVIRICATSPIINYDATK
jgi:hypothetical protein